VRIWSHDLEGKLVKNIGMRNLTTIRAAVTKILIESVYLERPKSISGREARIEIDEATSGPLVDMRDGSHFIDQAVLLDLRSPKKYSPPVRLRHGNTRAINDERQTFTARKSANSYSKGALRITHGRENEARANGAAR
jgi:hypothetical protein